jgi:hypothetical protein
MVSPCREMWRDGQTQSEATDAGLFGAEKGGQLTGVSPDRPLRIQTPRTHGKSNRPALETVRPWGRGGVIIMLPWAELGRDC